MTSLNGKQGVQRATYRAPEYNVTQINQGGHFCFLSGPKNTNLVEDIKILIFVSFVEFPSAVSWEKWKMSLPIKGQGGHLVFRYKLGRGL